MPAHNPLRCSHSAMAQRGASEVVLLDTGSYPAVSNYLNDTWTWNGTDWTKAAPATSPTPNRVDFALTYDGYNVVMFGGRGDAGDSVKQDTWTWNGTTWTKEAPATVPFGRFKAEFALFGTAGTAKGVLFGGSNVLNFLNETWIWNGSAKTWTLAAPAHSPPARIDHCLSNGATTCILFGGKGSVAPFGDTWSWNGTDWTQLTPTTPPPARGEAAMCFDTANNNWVLFGGRDDFNLLGDTWTLNVGGTAWTKKAPAASPSFRAGAQMCYDAQAGAVLLFGGNNQTDALNDTWKWTGSNWVQL